jgi:hypothetical protein
MTDLDTIIVDKSPAQKIARVDKLREELKPLGYSVVLTTYLAALVFQAKRLKRLEEAS